MLTRRELLQRSTEGAAALHLCSGHLFGQQLPRPDIVVNDVQSQLNATRVHEILRPQTVDDIQAAVRKARRENRAISIAGGRHAMGGQQFGRETLLLDMSDFHQVLNFDRELGQIEVQAGIQWPRLMEHLVRVQADGEPQWGVNQKQTGADQLSLGGALAANIHGRCLTSGPIIQDVESLLLVDGSGQLRHCSRRENRDLFSLVIGGYGLFGIVIHVTLRLVPRQKMERVVEVIELAGLTDVFESRIREGYLYGDFQYATDVENLLQRGVFSCYRPVPQETPIPEQQKQLSGADWLKLIELAHTDRRRAFDFYAQHYRATSGQIYWSDTHQLSTYVPDYHDSVNCRLGDGPKGTEMITEIYVPRQNLEEFLKEVREDFQRHQVEPIYGTIRLIEQDAESFLAWARKPWACVIFNLHVPHTPDGIAKAKEDFRRLIRRGIRHGGSYYLTYHRWAGRRQVETCYPQFVEFLELKRKHDPEERFQSEWYRHYRRMFQDRL
jgi:FAD/FMN-containing dehydrogenase